MDLSTCPVCHGRMGLVKQSSGIRVLVCSRCGTVATLTVKLDYRTPLVGDSVVYDLGVDLLDSVTNAIPLLNQIQGG